MSILSSPTTQDDPFESYFTPLNDDSYCQNNPTSPLHKKGHKASFDDCEIMHEESSNKGALICPKCNNGSLEVCQLSQSRFICICVNTNTGRTDKPECIYPLDSEEIASFIGGDGESAEKLKEKVKEYVTRKAKAISTGLLSRNDSL